MRTILGIVTIHFHRLYKEQNCLHLVHPPYSNKVSPFSAYFPVTTSIPRRCHTQQHRNILRNGERAATEGAIIHPSRIPKTPVCLTASGLAPARYLFIQMLQFPGRKTSFFTPHRHRPSSRTGWETFPARTNPKLGRRCPFFCRVIIASPSLCYGGHRLSFVARRCPSSSAIWLLELEWSFGTTMVPISEPVRLSVGDRKETILSIFPVRLTRTEQPSSSANQKEN